MRKIIISCLLMAGWFSLRAQPALWVFFTDKGPKVSERLAQPTTFLSEAALARRASQGIAVTAADLPVWPGYTAALRAEGWQVVATSRWLNAAVVRPAGGDVQALLDLPIIRGGQLVRTWVKPSTLASWEGPHESAFSYGEAQHQNEMLHIQALHDQGYTGRGVRLAILDGGFTGVDQMAAFDSLRLEGRLIATRDFVDGDDEVFERSTHGTQVFSAMAANAPGKLVGTAPHISVILARTEEVRSETQQEEYNFLQAVEWADSLGVDIIHASLGYSTFDGGENSYTYADMDGGTAITTRAVDMAAARGIIVTVAAGNEGNGRWHYITAPCDADSVLCIGSVDRFGARSSFSSFGPTADGRIKPDVVAMGTRTAVLNPNDRVSYSNGTSVASPLIAGMVACLRQAHPDRSNMDIIQAVRLSGDQAGLPDTLYGYGIPHAGRADSLLTHVADLSTVVITMTEKPVRGPLRPKPQAVIEPVEPARPAFTLNPQTTVNRTKRWLVVQAAPGTTLSQVTLMRDEEQVFFNPRAIAQSDTEVKLRTRYLLPGAYFFKVETPAYTEYIPVTIP